MRILRFILGGLLLAPASWAQPATSLAVARTPAARGQQALAVGFDAAGDLRAAACAAGPCSLAAGSVLPLDAEARALASAARLSVVRIAPDRRAVHVSIPDPKHGREWQAVILADAAQVQVPFSGWTGFISGEYGERRGPMVGVSRGEAGEYQIVVGEQREDLTLCGRPAILSPRLLSPADLTLRAAKVQRLSPEEREQATRLTAERLPETESPREVLPLLTPVAASSAIGDPRSLSDGDPATTWAENRGGSGRGEFVVMKTPPELPLSGFDVTIRPPPGATVNAQAAAPQEFWLATRGELFHVTMPEDAWKQPGARYSVSLPRAVQTDCLALVTESAFEDDSAAQVTFAELSARTQFDATALDGLVGALAGGGERAQAAASALAALGPKGFEAAAAAFDKLDEGGRRVALDLLDGAPCSISVPVFVRALLSPHRAHRIHARARIHRCGREAADSLVAALGELPPRAQPLMAAELALVAPARAVSAIVPRLSERPVERRRLLRVALARAVQSGQAEAAVREQLRNAELPAVALLDLLRALGDEISAYPEAGPAVARLAADPAFRTRFLLLEPAARLAASDPGARRFVEDTLARDDNPLLRAQAARVLRAAAPFQRALVAAVADPEMRVREAAVEKVKELGAGFAAPAVEARLLGDPWPLVRAASAEAIAALGPSSQLDAALVEALEDDSALVRAPAVRALGARGARHHAEAIRDLLTDRDESVPVRAAAASALGTLCDGESLDALTEYARKLQDPYLGELRPVASAALHALGRLHPADLQSRIAPLLDRRLPTTVQQAAQAALRAQPSCGRRVSRR